MKSLLLINIILLTSFAPLDAMQQPQQPATAANSSSQAGLMLLNMSKAVTHFAAQNKPEMAIRQATSLPGSLLNVSDATGRTALHHAAEKGFVDLAQLLLAKGADYQKADNAGDTPLALAERNQHDTIAAAILAKNG